MPSTPQRPQPKYEYCLHALDPRDSNWKTISSSKWIERNSTRRILRKFGLRKEKYHVKRTYSGYANSFESIELRANPASLEPDFAIVARLNNLGWCTQMLEKLRRFECFLCNPTPILETRQNRPNVGKLHTILNLK